jgi:uncharacterized protein YdcH (DUF465 family)
MLDQDPEVVDALLAQNEEFKHLYKRHQELDKQVDKAAIGNLPLDDRTMEEMKKERLWVKDRLVAIIDRYAQDRATG